MNIAVIEKHLSDIIQEAHEEIARETESAGVIPARFHVFSSSGIDIFVCSSMPPGSEEQIHINVRKMVTERRAFAVISVAEVWGIPHDKRQDFVAGMERGDWGDVEDYPGRESGVMVVLETASAIRLGQGVVRTGADGARMLCDLTMNPAGGPGAFKDLLQHLPASGVEA